MTIDITGKLPTEAECREFAADKDSAKRAKLIDRLLEKKDFAEIWAMKWAEMLMIRTTIQVSNKAAYLYANWLTDRISKNMPVNTMVRELLSANGGTFRNPATNYYQVENETLKTAENVAQQFMGIRVQCAVPQPSLRPLDHGRLLQLRGFLRANRPQTGGRLP